MPRKRKSQLTIGKRYRRNKYRKLNAYNVNNSNSFENDLEPQYNWNTELEQTFSFTPEKQNEDGNFSADNEAEYHGRDGSTAYDHMNTIIRKVQQAGQEAFFITFLTLILKDNFPFESIAFILFSEYVTWFSSVSTTRMRYSETSKEFWWSGMKMFGGRFIRFMQGFKHKGSIINGTAQRGTFDPKDTKINFAVPSESVISSFCPIESLRDLKGEIQPGICSPILQLCSRQSDSRTHILAFDGKKIVPNSAQIDLLGCEDADTLQQNECIKDDSQYMQKIQDLIEKFEAFNVQNLCEIPSESTVMLKNIILDIFRHVGRRIQLMRSIKHKKAYALEKLQSRTAVVAKDHYLMNYLKTFLLQCSIVNQQGIEILNKLCSIISTMNGSSFVDGNLVNLRECQNFAELLPPEKMKKIFKDKEVPSNYVKQRSEEWFAIRKDMKVTGSSVVRALGLNSLNEKKEFVKKLLGGKENDNSQNEAMQYGKVNEINAIATLVGKIIPVLYPDLTFCEEGVYKVYDEKDGTPFMVVSPDGSLRHSTDRRVNLHSNPPVSVEIKCPFSYTKGIPVYAEVPMRHIPQCYMEQMVLGSDYHLLLCWSTETTTLFRISQNTDTTKELLHAVLDSYHVSPPQRCPTKLSPLEKKLSVAISQEAKNCKFLGEFPSAVAKSFTSENCYLSSTSDGYPFIDCQNVRCEQLEDNQMSIEDACKILLNTKEVIQNVKKLYHKKASEVVVFTLSDTDRTWKKEIGHGIPIGYFFRGYSLTTACMRNIAKSMLEACVANDLHVPCTTFDGQWYKLLEDDENGKPLTLFQAHRYHWKEVSKLSTNKLLEEICRNISLDCSLSNMKSKTGSQTHSYDKTQSFILSEKNKTNIIAILKASDRKRKKFTSESLNMQTISDLFVTEERMNSLTLAELREVVRYLNQAENTGIPHKGNKNDLIIGLCRLFNVPSSIKDNTRKRRRVYNPSSLYSIVKSKMKKFGKKYLETVYAKQTWPGIERKWRESSMVSSHLIIKGVGTINPTYTPEKVSLKGKTFLHMKCLDGHHIRSNIRAKICKGGTRDIKKEAWTAVAKSGTTSLTPVMLEQNRDGKVLDQQNDQYIRVMFSKQVEDEMASMGYEEEAHFTKLLRKWHEAEDLPGIPAVERCSDALEFRKWLLKKYDFNTFPPPGGFVRGFPRITFEGMVSNIEAHLYMYSLSLTGTYNWRTMSTLVAENVFGEVSELESHNNGVPTGPSFRRDFTVMTGLNAVRLNPNRDFCMQTSKSRTYPIMSVEGIVVGGSQTQTPLYSLHIDHIFPRNHHFDLRRARKADVKLRKISDPFEPPRGVQPVRQYYKVDESKLLWSERLGIDVNNNEDQNSGNVASETSYFQIPSCTPHT